MTTVSREEFEAWAEHPVSQWILKAFGSQADALREDWIEGAWEADRLDPVEKTRAHTRWDILSQIGALTYETACAYAGQEQTEDEA